MRPLFTKRQNSSLGLSGMAGTGAPRPPRQALCFSLAATVALLILILPALLFAEVATVAAYRPAPLPQENIAPASSRPRLVVQTGHSAAIYAVGFSPDASLAFSGGEDNTVRIWDLASGRELQTLLHDREVRQGSFTGDGRRLLTVSYSGSGVGGSVVSLWDVASGRRLEELRLDFVCRRLAFSPDGAHVTLAGKEKGVVLRLQESSPYLGITAADPEPAAPSDEIFSPLEDGKSFALNRDRVAGRSGPVFRGHQDLVYEVVFSEDGTLLLSGSNDRTVRLWEAATGRDLRVLRGEIDSLYSVAAVRSGERIATGCRDGTFNLWEVGRGSRSQSQRLHDDIVYRTAFSPDEDLLYLSGPDSTKVWSIPQGKVVGSYPGEAMALALDAGGTVLASGGSDELVRLYDTASGKLLWQVPHHGWVLSLAVTETGVLVGSDVAPAVMLDRNSGKLLQKFAGPKDNPVSVAVVPDGSTVAAAFLSSAGIMLWDGRTGVVKGELKAPDFANFLAFSPDGSRLAAALQDGSIRLYDVAAGKEAAVLEGGHVGAVYSVAFSPDARLLWSAGYDKTLIAWDLATGSWLAKLFSFSDGSWAVVDRDGRFDTNNLEEIRGLHWVMADDPLRPLPLELFMKNYYEPRLLSRIIAGENFAPVPDLHSLNRLRPEVAISSVQREGEGETVTVEVLVTEAMRGASGAAAPGGAGAYDVKLFRDGQLVRLRQGKVDTGEEGAALLSFPRIRLPVGTGKGEVQFAAYAFNDAGIKGPTARQRYPLPAVAQTRQGVVYLITIGVNRYQNSSWDLQFAVNDATLMQEHLGRLLKESGRFREVVPVRLVDRQVTKENLDLLFARLAGRSVKKGALEKVDGGERVGRASPEDLVILTYSGHGHADGAGSFYLFPHDLGGGSERAVSERLLSRLISSEELEKWYREIDAGDLVLVIDACHSAASVAGGGFKPGPMGSRGLGQLAYDKGMRILAASQADDVALESGKLRQGLLTYALVHDGLGARQADFRPRNGELLLGEWLGYAVDRVPLLAQEVRKGKIAEFGLGAGERGTVLRLGKEKEWSMARRNPYQTPSLFDFTRGRKDPILTRY